MRMTFFWSTRGASVTAVNNIIGIIFGTVAGLPWGLPIALCLMTYEAVSRSSVGRVGDARIQTPKLAQVRFPRGTDRILLPFPSLFPPRP